MLNKNCCLIFLIIFTFNIIIIPKSYSNEFFINTAISKNEITNPLNINSGLQYFDRSDLNFTFYYIPSIVGMKELSNFGSSISYKFVDNNITLLSVSGLSNNLYQRIKTGLTYAFQIKDRLLCNISLNYLNINVSEYQSYNQFYLDFGAILPVVDKLSFGLNFHNINRSYNIRDFYIDQEAVFSTAYDILKYFSLDLNSYLILGMQWDFGIGSIFKYNDLVKIRLAYRNHPFTYELDSEFKIYGSSSIGMKLMHNKDWGYHCCLIGNIGW